MEQSTADLLRGVAIVLTTPIWGPLIAVWFLFRKVRAGLTWIGHDFREFTEDEVQE